jgi:hypothetical protein
MRSSHCETWSFFSRRCEKRVFPHPQTRCCSLAAAPGQSTSHRQITHNYTLGIQDDVNMLFRRRIWMWNVLLKPGVLPNLANDQLDREIRPVECCLDLALGPAWSSSISTSARYEFTIVALQKNLPYHMWMLFGRIWRKLEDGKPSKGAVLEAWTPR